MIRTPVNHERFRDLIANREDGVERGHRLLKNERDFGASHLAHLRLGQRQRLERCEQFVHVVLGVDCLQSEQLAVLDFLADVSKVTRICIERDEVEFPLRIMIA